MRDRVVTAIKLSYSIAKIIEIIAYTINLSCHKQEVTTRPSNIGITSICCLICYPGPATREPMKYVEKNPKLLIT